mgnify:CR=1 FL=1
MRRLGQRQEGRAHRRILGFALVALVTLSSPAGAAEPTEIMDSFSRDAEAAIDTSVSVSWEMEHREGRILREFTCLAHDNISGGGSELCPEGSQFLLGKEMVAQRQTHLLYIDTSIAYRRYFQASLRIPVVLHDLTELEMDSDGGVTSANSSVDPDNFPSLFSLPFSGSVRSGVKDPTLTLRVAPFSFARDQTQATWVIDLALTSGLVPVRQAGNSSVGEGTWRLDFGTAVSVRPEWWVEPWFRMDTFMRFQDAGSLFQSLADTQTLTSPGHAIAASLGTTFIPLEDVEGRSTLTIDVGAMVHYRFEGREYTELFEALGTSECDPSNPQPCDLTTYELGANSFLDDSERRKTDGVTDVEQYATASTWMNMRYQILEWVSVRAGFSFAYEMPHFITFADAGEDKNGDQVVQLEDPSDPIGQPNEYSPVYATALDSIGNRFRTGGMMTYRVMFGLEGKF